MQAEQRQPFAGARVRIQSGGMSSCAVPGTRKDYHSYHAFTFTDDALHRTELISGQHFEAAVEEGDAVRSFIFLELRQGGQHYKLEAVGYRRVVHRLLLDDFTTMMLPRSITRLLPAGDNADHDSLCAWCERNNRDEITLGLDREAQPLKTDQNRRAHATFQRDVARLISRSHGISLVEIVAALDEEQVKRAKRGGRRATTATTAEDDDELWQEAAPVVATQKRRTAGTVVNTRLRKKQKQDAEEVDSESEEAALVLTAVPVFDATVVPGGGSPIRYVFEDHTFATLAELTAHCSRECARLRHELAIEKVERKGELQVHHFERGRWQEALKPQLQASYLKGRLDGTMNRPQLEEPEAPSFESMFGPPPLLQQLV
jgi:hypothetical protein